MIIGVFDESSPLPRQFIVDDVSRLSIVPDGRDAGFVHRADSGDVALERCATRPELPEM